MIKNIQTKIILIFFVLGILMIGSISLFNIVMLEKMNQSIMSESVIDQAQFQQNIQMQIEQTKIISAIAIIVFLIPFFISSLLSLYCSDILFQK